MARADKIHAELTALATLSPVQLKKSWASLSGADLPHVSPSLLRHLIAQRLQEKTLGKLPAHVERELDSLSGSVGNAIKEARRGPILSGIRFVREWSGKTIAVTATEGAFEWDGGTYRSLSEIARTFTGAHWSGPRFFGLTARAS